MSQNISKCGEGYKEGRARLAASGGRDAPCGWGSSPGSPSALPRCRPAGPPHFEDQAAHGEGLTAKARAGPGSCGRAQVGSPGEAALLPSSPPPTKSRPGACVAATSSTDLRTQALAGLGRKPSPGPSFPKDQGSLPPPPHLGLLPTLHPSVRPLPCGGCPANSWTQAGSGRPGGSSVAMGRLPAWPLWAGR